MAERKWFQKVLIAILTLITYIISHLTVTSIVWEVTVHVYCGFQTLTSWCSVPFNKKLLSVVHVTTITRMFHLPLQSFILPNQPISEKTPLHMFQITTDTIEKASGLIAFDKVPRHNKKQNRPTIPLRIIDGLNQFDTFQALLKAWLPYFMPGFPGL